MPFAFFEKYSCKFITFVPYKSNEKQNNLMPKITALAITLNEEENVKRYVQSLSFADEIIFIDSNSTDATVDIAKELGVIVIQRKFDDFSSQRNFAMQQAKNDWIVFFDLDETISSELGKEIVSKISQNNFVAFYAQSNFFFMEEKIKHGSWRSKKSIKVFNKNFCKYNGDLVQETIIANGKTASLKERFTHYDYKNFDHYNNKLNLHSKLEAKALYTNNLRPNAYHFFVRPMSSFLSQYLFRLGFLDGKEGFILAYIHSFAIFKRYLQLWLMYRKME